MLDWKNVAAELKNRLDGYERRTDIRGAGVVLSAGDGVVQLDGLGGCKLNELLEFDSGAYAIVMNLEEDRVGAVLLGNDAHAGRRRHAVLRHRPGTLCPRGQGAAGPRGQPPGPAA